MSTYTISYEVDAVPADLPANAKVERQSVLPVVVTPLNDRKVTLSDGGQLTIEETRGGSRRVFAYPSKDDARKLIEGLQEYVGELPPVELPLTFQTGRNRRVEVEKRGIAVGARIQITNTSYTGETVAALLDEDETRKVAHGLLATIGEVPQDVTPAQARGAVSLPFSARTDGRTFRVEKSHMKPGGAFVSMSNEYDHVGGSLSANDARDFAHAILTAIGDTVPQKSTFTRDDSEPGEHVKAVRDKDGDVWYRRPENYDGGKWSMSKFDSNGTASWSHVRTYAPLTVVTD